MNRLTLMVGLVVVVLCFWATCVRAQTHVVVADENGNAIVDGLPVTGTIAVEPVSGLSTLRYSLTFPVVAGDALVINSLDVTPQNQSGYSDLIRFGAGGSMYFFSLIDDSGPPDPADVPAFPNLALNTVVVFEVGPEGNNSAPWNPTAINHPGAPGDPAQTAHYTFISDVPEPGAAMLACLSAGMILRRRKGVQSDRSRA